MTKRELYISCNHYLGFGTSKIAGNVWPVTVSRGSKRAEFSLLRYNFFVKTKHQFTENSAIAVTGGYALSLDSISATFIVSKVINMTTMKSIRFIVGKYAKRIIGSDSSLPSWSDQFISGFKIKSGI